MIIFPRNKTSSHFQIISFLKYSKVCLIVIMQTIAFVYSKLLSWTKKHADVAHSVSRGPSELEGRQFDPRHSIDDCFDPGRGTPIWIRRGSRLTGLKFQAGF